jgi:hypothetical protein
LGAWFRTNKKGRSRKRAYLMLVASKEVEEDLGTYHRQQANNDSHPCVATRENICWCGDGRRKGRDRSDPYRMA